MRHCLDGNNQFSRYLISRLPTLTFVMAVNTHTRRHIVCTRSTNSHGAERRKIIESNLMMTGTSKRSFFQSERSNVQNSLLAYLDDEQEPWRLEYRTSYIGEKEGDNKKNTDL
jgi:hypothetical protein